MLPQCACSHETESRPVAFFCTRWIGDADVIGVVGRWVKGKKRWAFGATWRCSVNKNSRREIISRGASKRAAGRAPEMCPSLRTFALRNRIAGKTKAQENSSELKALACQRMRGIACELCFIISFFFAFRSEPSGQDQLIARAFNSSDSPACIRLSIGAIHFQKPALDRLSRARGEINFQPRVQYAPSRVIIHILPDEFHVRQSAVECPRNVISAIILLPFSPKLGGKMRKWFLKNWPTRSSVNLNASGSPKRPGILYSQTYCARWK